MLAALWAGLLFILQTGSQVANATCWCMAGVSAWTWAFTVSGRLRTRDPVSDNVRIVRHQSFIIAMLCFGTALVGGVEAIVATHVSPWWLQLLTNAGLTTIAFVFGCRVFGFSHEWVLRDPELEKPMFLLDVCMSVELVIGTEFGIISLWTVL